MLPEFKCIVFWTLFNVAFVLLFQFVSVLCCIDIYSYHQAVHRQLLRPAAVLGTFKLDIATVMSQQGSIMGTI